MRRANLLLPGKWVATALFGAVITLWGPALPLLAAQENPNDLPRDETQIWQDIQFSKPLSPRIEWNASVMVRVGRGFAHIVQERASTGITIRAGRHLTFSPSYLWADFRPLPGRNSREHRLYLDGTLHFAAGNFLISDRNRVEQRFTNLGNFVRYRNRIQIEHPVEIGHAGLRAFVYDEFQYTTQYHAWDRNRFAVGVGKTLSRAFALDVYYLRQNDRHAHPGDLHAICTTLKVRL